MYSEMSLSGLSASRKRSWATMAAEAVSFTSPFRQTMRSLSRRENMSSVFCVCCVLLVLCVLFVCSGWVVRYVCIYDEDRFSKRGSSRMDWGEIESYMYAIRLPALHSLSAFVFSEADGAYHCLRHVRRRCPARWWSARGAVARTSDDGICF